MQFSKDISKENIFSEIEQYLRGLGFSIANKDASRPWGGFFVIDETQADLFIKAFFPQLSLSNFSGFSKLSPKILLVAPEERLSWQYHFRRSEIWTVIGGNAAIVISDSDEETPQKGLPLGSIVELAQGERHRLVGVDEWGVIAEIWKHTDAENPSDEYDIVRVQDDFGR